MQTVLMVKSHNFELFQVFIRDELAEEMRGVYMSNQFYSLLFIYLFLVGLGSVYGWIQYIIHDLQGYWPFILSLLK